MRKRTTCNGFSVGRRRREEFRLTWMANEIPLQTSTIEFMLRSGLPAKGSTQGTVESQGVEGSPRLWPASTSKF